MVSNELLNPPPAAAAPTAGSLIERIAKFVQNLTVIFGVFWASMTYLSAQHQSRVDRTLDYRKDFVGDVRKNYLDLMDRWETASSKNDDVFSADPAKRDAVSLDFFSIDENRQQLNEMEEFFDPVLVCVRNRGCDINTAKQLFDNDASILFEIAEPFILKTRAKDRDPQYGRGLEGLYKLPTQGLISQLWPF